MNQAQQILDLLDTLHGADVRALSPMELRRFEALTFHWNQLAARWRDDPSLRRERAARGRRNAKVVNGKRRKAA